MKDQTRWTPHGPQTQRSVSVDGIPQPPESLPRDVFLVSSGDVGTVSSGPVSWGVVHSVGTTLDMDSERRVEWDYGTGPHN